MYMPDGEDHNQPALPAFASGGGEPTNSNWRIDEVLGLTLLTQRDEQGVHTRKRI